MVIRKTIDEEQFLEFAKDHIKHFNAIPCEFETRTGEMWGTHKCWKIAEKHELTKTIKNKKGNAKTNYTIGDLIKDLQKFDNGMKVIVNTMYNNDKDEMRSSIFGLDVLTDNSVSIDTEFIGN